MIRGHAERLALSGTDTVLYNIGPSACRSAGLFLAASSCASVNGWQYAFGVIICLTSWVLDISCKYRLHGSTVHR